MSNIVKFPVIAGVEVTTDDEGRFNLNALHKASKEGEHKKPSEWLRTKQAQELVAALKAQSGNSTFGTSSAAYEPLSIIRGGNAPGTFAHELLAVSYAGWINPVFQLTVNQTFIDYRTGKTKMPMSPAELIIAQGQALLAVERQQARQAQQIAALEHRLSLMDGDTGYLTVTAYLRKHGWKLPLSKSRAIGQHAAKLAKELGVQIGTVPDERFGTVNSYPIALLDEVVAEFFGKEDAA